MKALSIRAPWWWLILHAGKDIENRDWYTSYRGPVLLHASKWFGKQEVYDDFKDAREFMVPQGVELPVVTLNDLRGRGGHIVGQVDIVGCVTSHNSRWFQGKYGFVLRNPVALVTPYPAKGALRFFNVELGAGRRAPGAGGPGVTQVSVCKSSTGANN